MECLLLVIEQLSAHFAQWSFHISFPELATIPLIRLRKFHDSTTVDSLQRIVKRFIDQVLVLVFSLILVDHWVELFET